MIRALAFSAAVLMTAGSVGTAHAQAALIPDAVAEAVRSSVDEGQRVGVVIGYWQGGQSEFYAYGRTAAGGEPLNADTIFEVGSVTKVFTGELLASLVVSGQLRLETPLLEIWPHATVNSITLADLATHTAGLPRDIPLQALEDGTDDTLLALIPDTASPADVSYSSAGMALLARAMEVRTGTPLAVLLGRITEPAGLTSTGYHPVDPARLAAPHLGRSDIGDTRPRTVPIGRGAGGLFSTPRDLMAFMVLHIPGHQHDGMGFMQLALDGHDGLPLGWQVHWKGDTRIFHHSGEASGYQVFIGFDPEEGGRAVVLMSNSSVEDDLQNIALHLLDADVPLPSFNPDEGRISDEDIQYLAGTYTIAGESGENTITLIGVESGLGYMEQGPDGAPVRRSLLEVVAPGELRLPGTPVLIRFDRDQDAVHLVVGDQIMRLLRDRSRE